MIEITTRDTESGKTEKAEIEDDFVIITAGTYYLDSVSRYGNGTVQLTIKTRRADRR